MLPMLLDTFVTYVPGCSGRVACVATCLEVRNGEYETQYSDKERVRSPRIGKQSESEGKGAGDKEP